MSDELKSIIDEIEKKKKIAVGRKTLADIVDPYARRTKLGHIKRAEEDLKTLYKEYRTLLHGRAAFILVSGSQCDQYSKMAEEDFGCFSVDAEDFYKAIIEKVPPKLYTNVTSSPSLFEHLMARFEERAVEIGIVSYQGMYFKAKYKKLLKNKKDVLEIAKRAFNEAVGGEVVGLDALDKVAAKAIEEGFVAKTAPIVLYTKDVELVKSLSRDLGRIASNTFIVTTGQKPDKLLKENALINVTKVTKESLEKSLLKVKEQLN